MEGVTRVIRGCGWLPNDQGLEGRTCFKRTGTANVSGIPSKRTVISRDLLRNRVLLILFQIQVTHCVCQGDGCNSAPARTTGTFAVAALGTLFVAVISSMP